MLVKAETGSSQTFILNDIGSVDLTRLPDCLAEGLAETSRVVIPDFGVVTVSDRLKSSRGAPTGVVDPL